MPDVAKLKKKAAEFELKKQFDKALAAYVEILDSYARKADQDADLSLYNRVGDLYLKQGNVADAVDYYEQAVDRYTDGGFFNNAIALCNKILRNSPGRASVYYKLGKISAHKGFKGDAKANFLEYADRMQQAGKIDESFRALKEFADLCPDQDDIRLMLADQLSRKGRGPEAVEQLQLLHARYIQEGRDAEASATVERMKAIDPASEPKLNGSVPRRAAGDLVFLDLGEMPPPSVAQHPTRPAPPPPSVAKRLRATEGLELLATGEHVDVPTAAVPPRNSAPDIPELQPDAPRPEVSEPEFVEFELEAPDVGGGLTGSADFDRGRDPGNAAEMVQGLETTAFEPMDTEAPGSLLDFEPTNFGADAHPLDAAPSRDAPMSGNDGDMLPELLDFEMPDARQAGPREVAPREVLQDPEHVASGSRPSLSDLPMLDDGPDAFVDGPSIGGDLQLIMPDDDLDERAAAAAERQRAAAARVDEIPLMDLELPVAGEAASRISGSPVPGIGADELEMIDFDAPEPDASLLEADLVMPDSSAAVTVPELTPAELDVRGGLLLDVDTLPQSDDSLPESAFGDDTPSVLASADPESESIEETGDYDAIPAHPRRNSTMLAAQSVDMLMAQLDDAPDDNGLRRRLGEAMLESGDREGGQRELEAAMIGYERADDLVSAASLADEIVLMNPSSVRHHQKRVEYAFRTNERGRLIDAYLQLADALLRAEQVDKSRAIYQRVLDLAPDDLRATTALQSFPEPEPAPAPSPPKGRASVAMPRPAAPLRPIVTSDDEFVNLGDWLRDDEAPKDTRMIVEEKEPSGDEEADFQDMLRKFKQGIAENVEEEDHQSHYDLGVAYKEMGLLDEAIAEFQKALRGPANRVPAYEALGQCFIEKEQYPMAATILQRAVAEKGVTDDQLVGVLYLLGTCAERRGQNEQAVQYYQRVFVIDIRFRDVGDRLAAMESGA